MFELVEEKQLLLSLLPRIAFYPFFHCTNQAVPGVARDHRQFPPPPRCRTRTVAR